MDYKNINENWQKFLEQEDESEEGTSEEENILDLGKELDSGFCQFNPLINQYAQHSPEGLAEMLIFVIATQQQRWYDVVPKFPVMMAFIRKEDGLLDPAKATTNEKGEIVYDIPKAFSQLTLGFRKGAIQWVWDNKDTIYSSMKPLFDQFNKSGEDTIAKEEAMFKIYIELLKVKGLGLPKAAFASQLIIGRLGCIDSINLNLYKGLDPKGQLITYDKKKGTPNFKTPSKKEVGGIIQITKGGIQLAEKYVQFLKHIAELTRSSEAKISQQLWDSWCELVALKINKAGDIKVKMPGGEEFRVPNDYSKNIKGAETNPSAAFRKKYIGKISAKDISRQHDPRTMFEGFDRWSKYVYSLLNEEKKKGDRCVRIAKRKYDVWPSAYASGAVVKCRQGKIWKGVKEEKLNEIIDEEIEAELEEGIGSFIRNAALAGTMAAGALSPSTAQAAEPVAATQVAEQGDEIKFDEKTKMLSVTVDVEEGDNGEFAESQARDLVQQWQQKNGYQGHSYEGKKIVKGNRFNPERISFLFQMQKAVNEKKKKPDFKKEKESGLHGWFSRQGGKGKSKGWVDCNTCRTDKETGKKTCKTCGRKEGEKRAKYPSCRPKPSDCGSSGKGEDWGKKSS